MSDSALYIPAMSNPGGRHLGSKNQPGHSAGGVRAGAGRHLEPKKRKTDSSASQIRMTKLSGSGSDVHSASASSFKVLFSS
jgi:hypothetical protein